MRNGVRGARYLKFVGELIWVIAALAMIKFLLDGSIKLAGFWYVCGFGFAVFIIGLFGYMALVRLYSFFQKPKILRSRINRKGIESQYEIDYTSGKGYELKSKDYQVCVGSMQFNLTRRVYHWVALGDNVAIRYIPCTSEVIWVDDVAAAKRVSAEAHYKEAQYDKAISDFSTAIRLNYTDGHTYYERGLAYAANGQYAQAITDYTLALLKHRRRRRYFSTTASLNYYGEEDQMRIAAEVQQAIIYYHRGLAYAAKGKHFKAIADYTEGITLNLGIKDVYMARAEAHAALGNRTEAVSDFTTFIQRSENQGLVAQARERIHELQQQKPR